MESGAIVKCLPLSAPADGETSYPNLSSSGEETQIQTYNLSPAGGETQRGGAFAIQLTET